MMILVLVVILLQITRLDWLHSFHAFANLLLGRGVWPCVPFIIQLPRSWCAS
jgi:hypothetical protein